MLGIERTSEETIARSSVDFVTSLVILSSLTNLAIVEKRPEVGKRDKIMIAKSKQFQGSLKYLCSLGYSAISLNASSTMKTATTRLWIKPNVPDSSNSSSLPTERIAGVASRARASAWRRITPVIIQSNVLLVTIPPARPTTLLMPLSDDDCPHRAPRDDDFFFSMYLPKHSSSLSYSFFAAGYRARHLRKCTSSFFQGYLILCTLSFYIVLVHFWQFFLLLLRKLDSLCNDMVTKTILFFLGPPWLGYLSMDDR